MINEVVIEESYTEFGVSAEGGVLECDTEAEANLLAEIMGGEVIPRSIFIGAWGKTVAEEIA